MRTFLRIILVAGIGVATYYFFTTFSTANNNKNTEVAGTPGSPTPTALPSAAPADTQAPATAHATCTSTASATSFKAHSFMKTHQQRNAAEALSLISDPVTSEEAIDQSNLLGSDTNEGPRLYSLTQFSYKTSSYRLGTVQLNGQDAQERGAIRCTYAVYETRVSDGTTGHTEQTVTRYIDFAVDEAGNVKLTAFRDSPTGKKYSGFN